LIPELPRDIIVTVSREDRTPINMSLHAPDSTHSTEDSFANRSHMGYPTGMIDLKLEEPVTEEIEVDAETLAAIDRGLEAADRGETVSLGDARKMIPRWISKFESRPQR
jgi:predicted transcriptional regulator